MPARLSFWAFALVLCSCLEASVPMDCAPGTLASYEALGSTGCLLGPINAINFSFHVDFATGGATALTDDQIKVTPTFDGQKASLALKADGGPGFSVTGSQAVQYLIGYTWDPSDDISSVDDVLDDPVSPPGILNITTSVCIGAGFSGTSCSGSMATLNVFDTGGAHNFFSSTSFPGTPVVGFRNTIELVGNDTGSASFNSLTGEAVLSPEPHTLAAMCSGLALMVWRIRVMRSRTASALTASR